jgi:serine/threonine-protein kinase
MAEEPNDLLDRLPPGTQVEGRYEILDVLGEGGFATVYRARQLNIQRTVALKVLNPSSDPRAKASFEDRFLREAHTAAQITHPNVVTIYDFGFTTSPRRPFIVMEILEGHDLERELQERGPLSPQRALPLFLECLEALAEAHRRGIIHKDLKPSNLYVIHPGTRREALKLLDFGIARVQNVQGKLTNTGQILGTPQYLAPEYIQSQLATPALDVYQMGLILAEALYGKAIVDSDNPYKCLMIHGSGQLELPEPLLQPPLGPILLKALAHDHEARYANAEEFRQALEEISPAQIPLVPSNSRTLRVSDVTAALRRGTPIEAFAPPSFPVSVNTTGQLSNDAGFDLAPTRPELPATPPPLAASGWATSPNPAASVLTQEAAPVAAPNKMPLLLGVVGVVLVLLLVAVGVVAKMAMQEQGDPNPPVGQLPPTDPPKEAPTPDPQPDLKQPPEPPVTFARKLTTEPASAQIFQGDKLLGTGVAVVEFAAPDAPELALVVRAEGYADRPLALGPSSQPESRVVLDPLPPVDPKDPKLGDLKGKDPKGKDPKDPKGKDPKAGDPKIDPKADPTAKVEPVPADPPKDTPKDPPKDPKDKGKGAPSMGFVE